MNVHIFNAICEDFLHLSELLSHSPSSLMNTADVDLLTVLSSGSMRNSMCLFAKIRRLKQPGKHDYGI